MALGALLLECDNYELWVALGCLSDYGTLKQHCLIRALQLDASLAVAWAHLGKVYCFLKYDAPDSKISEELPLLHLIQSSGDTIGLSASFTLL